MHRITRVTTCRHCLQAIAGRAERAVATLRFIALVMGCGVLLTGCLGSQASPAGEVPGSGQGQPAGNVADAAPCADLAITVADLPRAQTLYASKRDAMQREASAWQADAQLVSVDVGCDFGLAAECVMGGGVDQATRGSQEDLEECVAGGDDALSLSAVFYSPQTDKSWSYPERDEIIDLAEQPLDAGKIDFAWLQTRLNQAEVSNDMLLPAGVSATAGDDVPLQYSLMAYPPGDDAAVQDLIVNGIDGTVSERAAAA